MAALVTTITFANGDQVTSDKLNQIISGATFDSGAVADSSLVVVGGQLKLGTVTSANMGTASVNSGALASNSVTNAKIADGSVTNTKLGNLSVTNSKIGVGAVGYDNIDLTYIAFKGVMETQLAGYLVTPSVVRYSPGVAKAAIDFSIESSSRTIPASSYNITSISRISATQTQINWDIDMNGGSYQVQVSGGSDGTEIVTASYYDRTAGSVKIRHTTEGPQRRVSVTIFGVSA